MNPDRSIRRHLSRPAVAVALVAGTLASLVISLVPGAVAHLAPALAAAAPTISTVAGNSCSPADATKVGLQPAGVGVDGSGNVYVADTTHSVVCKVTPTGTMTRIAGNGAAGFIQDGVAAASTELYSPTGVAVDSSGNVYIADRWNQRIRKVTAATGIISTVAGSGSAGFSGDGGQATAAQLNFPTGVAVDSSGNVYLADGKNNRVRKVAAATGVITTVAGNGVAGYSGDGGAAAAAELNNPSGVAIDTTGALYIADTRNARVRKVASGVITTRAGTGVAGYSGDGGPATQAQLNIPGAVAVDNGKNVYVADAANNRIRRISKNGTISTVLGDGSAAALSFPQGVAVDSSRNVYGADTGNNRVRRRDASLGGVSTPAGNGTPGYSVDSGTATQAELNHPNAVATDTAGNLYVADGQNEVVRKVTPQGAITTIAGRGGVAGWSGDGGPATSATIGFVTGVAVDAAGNVYLADWTNHIRKVDTNGTISTVAGTGTAGYSGDGGPASAAALRSPSGLAVDTAGNLYVADSANNRVRRIDAATGVITTLAGTGAAAFAGDGGPVAGASLSYPTDVKFDGAGNLYVADRNNQRIRRIDSVAGAVSGLSPIETVAGDGVVGYSPEGTTATSSALNYPTGVALDAGGNLFIADTGNCLVREVANPGTTSATIQTVVGWTPIRGLYPVCGYAGDGGPPNGGGTRLYSPTGVVFDPAGNYYIADSLSNAIRKVG